MKGVRTTAASKMLQRYVPVIEVRAIDSLLRVNAWLAISPLTRLQSTMTARLAAAGAVVVGKTNMVCQRTVCSVGRDSLRGLRSQDEFGMGSFNVFSAHGPTISPLVAADKPGAHVTHRAAAYRGPYSAATLNTLNQL